jgi:hypothetical protein
MVNTIDDLVEGSVSTVNGEGAGIPRAFPAEAAPFVHGRLGAGLAPVS